MKPKSKNQSNSKNTNDIYNYSSSQTKPKTSAGTNKYKYKIDSYSNSQKNEQSYEKKIVNNKKNISNFIDSLIEDVQIDDSKKAKNKKYNKFEKNLTNDISRNRNNYKLNNLKKNGKSYSSKKDYKLNNIEIGQNYIYNDSNTAEGYRAKKEINIKKNLCKNKLKEINKQIYLLQRQQNNLNKELSLLEVKEKNLNTNAKYELRNNNYYDTNENYNKIGVIRKKIYNNDDRDKIPNYIRNYNHYKNRSMSARRDRHGHKKGIKIITSDEIYKKSRLQDILY